MTSHPVPSNSTVAMTLTCDEYIDYVTELLEGSDWEVADDVTANRTAAERHYYIISHVINGYAVPAICVFGVVGNLLNLVVLTRKRLQRSMKHMERSVNNGLVALAISDMFFCLTYFMTFLCHKKPAYVSTLSRLELYCRAYQEPIINYFLLSSTWLTVVMAVGRYVAVCRPLHARGFINQRDTRIAICAVYLGSFIINLPRFWHYRPSALPCSDLNLSVTLHSHTSPVNSVDAATAASSNSVTSDCQCFYYVMLADSYLFRNAAFNSVYTISWAIVAIFVPLIVLIVCNWCLIRALQRSSAMHRRYCQQRISLSAHGSFAQSAVDVTPSSTGHRITESAAASPSSSSSSTSPSAAAAAMNGRGSGLNGPGRHRITPTLVALIVLFITLVGPSEILTFSKEYVTPSQVDVAAHFRFRSAVDVTNCLLLINFAFNVVLYCAINAHFRRVVRHLLCGVVFRRRNRNGSGSDVITVWMKSTQNTVTCRATEMDGEL